MKIYQKWQIFARMIENVGGKSVIERNIGLNDLDVVRDFQQ
jgi:hypothetical protein